MGCGDFEAICVPVFILLGRLGVSAPFNSSHSYSIHSHSVCRIFFYDKINMNVLLVIHRLQSFVRFYFHLELCVAAFIFVPVLKRLMTFLL